MRYQRLFIFFSIAFLQILFASLTQGIDKFIVNDNQIVTKNFLGFGAEWDTYYYNGYNISDKDFKLITDRISNMKLPIVRIMVLGKYCYLGNGKYNWNSDSMISIYKQLDFCQKEGIKVIVCAWGAGYNPNDWLKIHDVSGVDDPKYADVVGTIMDYLLNTKGYTCIKYFSTINEPDLQLRNNWGMWLKCMNNFADNFKRHGLTHKLILLGPEITESNADNWLKNSSVQLSSLLGVYSLHLYASRNLVKSGGLESIILKNMKYVSNSNSVAASKPFFITEAGMSDDFKPPYGNPHISDFQYGIFMADYAVQAARAGSSAILAWMLDDNSHKDFYWGMWANKIDNFKIRPWYYAWSLLSRIFPNGATVYRVEQPKDIRILVARIHGSTDEYWSICLVNRASSYKTMGIKVPEAKNTLFSYFNYYSNASTNDVDFFNKSVIKMRSDISGSIIVNCPPNSIVVLTSLQT
ncbi:MAG: hypothetical protein CXR30_00865 [Geobacter sp.]|nr:MAG: hypothetical protein CXR30_00865 [Geobacter sp.]